MAGLLASIASIVYPAISALVSKNASSEQQGVALGILTGVRGLCNGLGPALFGLLFWLFNVSFSGVDHPEVWGSNAHVSAMHTLSGHSKKNVTSIAVHVSVCLELLSR